MKDLSTRWLPAIALVGLALNLRPIMAGVSPLLDQIEIATGLSHTGSSLLTTIPVAVIGLCALLSGPLQRRLGERRGVTLGIALIVLACLIRYLWPTRTGLIATAALAGVGIALQQVLLPVFIKRVYAGQAGGMFGLYTTAIMGGAALAAASAASSYEHFALAGALGLWGLPALLALLLWLFASRQSPQQSASQADVKRLPALWKNRRAWELLVFFGIGTGAYTLVLAWLPAYYISLGWERAHAGYLLGGLTVTEVVVGLLVSAFAARFPDRRGPLWTVLALLLAGLLLLVWLPDRTAVLISILLGLGIGALFPLSLIVTVDHLDDPRQAGQLAAFVQGGGYLIASLMPLVAGALRDGLTDLSYAWLIMAAGCALLAAMVDRFSPSSYASVTH